MAVTVTQEPMVITTFRLLRTRRETRDTFTLELEPWDGSEGPDFSPGQFNMLYVFGVGEVPVSISGDPSRSQTLVHTVRAVGTVTRALVRLKAGEVLGVRGPFGSSWPVQEAEGSDVVMVTGGVGLAPLRPALYHILSRRDRYGRVSLVYGARTPEDVIYRRELERWRGRFDLEVEITADRADREWRGNVGVVTTLIPRVPVDPLSTVALVCGPEVMIRYAVMGIEELGVMEESIFISLERNMKCGIGLCGHCQFGPNFICKDGPVFPYQRVKGLFGRREV